MDDILDRIFASRQQSGPDINGVAAQYGVDPALVRAVMQQESGGNPNARSPKGAIGLMQLMPATAAQYGADPNDPVQNLRAGVQHLAYLQKKYNGDRNLMLAAYNAGEGNVDKAGGVPNFPETQHYVKNVEAHLTQNASGATQPASDDILDRIMAARGGDDPGFLANVASSGENFAKGLYNTVRHPLDTMETLGKLGAGAIEHLAPDTVHAIRNYASQKLPASWANPNDPSFTPFQLASAAGAHYKERYGSLDALKHTAYTDPVGTMADVASVAVPAGKLMSGAGELSNLSRVAQVGRGVSKIGELADPVNIATKGISTLVQGPANAMAEHIANVNLQVPKAMRRREANRVGGVPHAEAVLNTGRGTNPFTRFSQGGLENAQKVGNEQQALKAGLRNADEALGHTYDVSPIDSAMESNRAYWAADPTEGLANEALIDRKRANFIGNDAYGHDRIQFVPKQVQVQTPHPFAVDAQGNPIMQTTTQWVLEPEVVGRDFNKVGANTLEKAKGPVYTRQAENYGPGRDAVGAAVDKSAASAADKILDTNIPGYDRASRTQQQAEVARKALTEAIETRRTKRKGLFAESMAFAAPILAGEGHPYAGGAMGAIAAYNTIAKHPWLASPVASGLWSVGHFAAPSGMGMLTPATQANQSTKRTVTAGEVVPSYQAYLDASRKNDDQK